ncbi:MAG: cyclic nucleotide-binding domain-containing protein [Thermoanaerobaculaceae bacterium]|jgi:CRP/FNR family cyclic AMP-dependent transcriptional regulator|nr:cyclic nucleotide-binding domain-containing protein [Thermoanaerobaculaceae bacterium]
MPADAVDALRSSALFAGLSEQELENLANLVRRVSYPKGTVVFAEGDPGDALYFVEAGRVRISKVLSGVGEEALAIFGPGSVFGEMAVLDGGRRSADAIVHEDARLLVLDRDRFQELLREDKEFAYQVLTGIVRSLAGRVREMNDKLFAFYALAAFT